MFDMQIKKNAYKMNPVYLSYLYTKNVDLFGTHLDRETIRMRKMD